MFITQNHSRGFPLKEHLLNRKITLGYVWPLLFENCHRFLWTARHPFWWQFDDLTFVLWIRSRDVVQWRWHANSPLEESERVLSRNLNISSFTNIFELLKFLGCLSRILVSSCVPLTCDRHGLIFTERRFSGSARYQTNQGEAWIGLVMLTAAFHE